MCTGVTSMYWSDVCVQVYLFTGAISVYKCIYSQVCCMCSGVFVQRCDVCVQVFLFKGVKSVYIY